MATLLWIMLGGAVGTGARYLVVTSLQSGADGFPYGTLTVNLVGCLIIGIMATVLADAVADRQTLKLALIVGCLEGFTTFSSFGLETVNLLQAGQHAWAATYVLVSNVIGVGLAWCGYRLGTAISG